MGWLFLGVCLLLALLLGARWFVNANPADLARWVRWIGIVLLGLGALFLMLTGRFAFGIPLAMLALAMFRRWRLPNIGPSTFGGRGGGGQTSEVTTDYLRMTLEHASGLMRGTVLKGAFTGQELADLDREQLLSLLAECHREDPSSAQLLESYLERAYGEDWRGAEGPGSAGGTGARPPPGGPMSREEALEILGLEPDASAEEVRAAYRTLMQKLHPDQGGSTYLAAKINQAKDVLLRS